MKLEKNIYGQKHAGRVWNSFLADKLMSLGFTPSLIDNCGFFYDDIIFMVYVDDDIFLENDDSKLQATIQDFSRIRIEYRLVSTSRNYKMVHMSSPNVP